MNNFSQKIKQQGRRLTKQRQQILEVLSSCPQSVSEILLTLQTKDNHVDKVTIYRNLDYFVNLGIAVKTQFKEREAKYELLSKNNHHHHLVCDECGLVEDIHLDEKYLLKKASQSTNFQISNHLLEFFGTCPKCQA